MLFASQMYSRKGAHADGLELLRQQRPLILASDSSWFRHRYFSNTAILFYQAGQLDSAARYYLADIRAAQDSDKQLWQASGLNGLALVYTRQDRHDKAIETYRELIELLEGSGRTAMQAIAYLNLASALTELDQSDEAVLAAKKALGFNPAHYSTLHTLAMAYRKLGQPDSAMHYALGARAVTPENNDYDLAAINSLVGHIALDLADYETALHYLQASEQNGLDAEAPMRLQTTYELLAQAYAATGNFRAAYEAQQNYRTYRDSTESIELKTELAELETRFETERTQRENAQLKTEAAEAALELERAENRNLLLRLLLFVLIGVVALVAFFLWRLALARKKLAQANATKDRFFSIIAHDLRGATTSLQGMGDIVTFHVEQGNYERLSEVGDMIGQRGYTLSAMLDNLLSWAMSQRGTVPYKPQKLNVAQRSNEVLAQVAQQAQAKNVILNNHIAAEATATADPNAFNLIMRNLLSNAIKFTPANGSVTLDSETSNGQTIIRVTDTGTGMEQAQIDSLFSSVVGASTRGTSGEKGSGLGLRLVHDFVRLNKGTLNITSKPGQGTTLQVQLPS